MNCKKCGTPVSDTSAFCSECGTKIIKLDTTKKFCTECGAQMSADARFCSECGFDSSSITYTPNIPVNTIDQPVTETPEPEIEQTQEVTETIEPVIEDEPTKQENTEPENNICECEDVPLANKDICASCGNSLNGMRFCINCGHDSTSDTILSQETPIEEPQQIIEETDIEPEAITEESNNESQTEGDMGFSFCLKCGAPLIPGYRFCKKCGFDTTVVKIQQEEVNNEPKIEQNTRPSFCLKCGKKLTPNDVFCPECGRKIE